MKFFLLLFLLSGCMVGPNYQPPPTCMPANFQEDLQEEMDCVADTNLENWWEHFQDPCLDKLLAEALRANFDLLIAVERMAQNRAYSWNQFTKILPEIHLDGTATRTRGSETLIRQAFFDPVQDFFQTGLAAIWEIDVFGGLRRSARSAYFTWEASAEEVRSVRLMVLAEVAITYVNIRALQQQRERTRHLIALDEELLHLSKVRLEAGLANEQQFANYLAQLEQNKGSLELTNIALKQAIYSLSILLGRLPETLLAEFETTKSVPLACGKIPIGLPSDLLRRRPDIRGAERNLAAATEEIGVAVAALFPTFSLTGSSSSFSANPLQGANYGYASNSLSDLFKSISRVWGLGIFTDWPLFDFGKRLANVDVQIFLRNQAFLTYEKIVIQALQEVESNLVAYFHESARELDLERGVSALGRVLELTGDQFQAGLLSYDQVLVAKQKWLQAQIDLVESQQAVANNLISLYKALGGGWSCSTMP